MAKQEKDPKQIELARKLNHVPWCEEYEKMISGMLYNSFSPPLESARIKARKFCHKYNHHFPTGEDVTFGSLKASRMKHLRHILGAIGDDAFIEPPFYFDYGCNINIGERFYSNFDFKVIDCGLVTIGDRVMMGPGVSIYAATHETEVQSRRDDIEYTMPVVIGNDCWIGGQTVILPGVEIGQGCTIAAGSIVTKNIPEWSVAMGQPAKVVRKVTPLPPPGEENVQP